MVNYAESTDILFVLNILPKRMKTSFDDVRITKTLTQHQPET